MAIDNFEIVGGYNNQRFPNIDAERTINMFEFIDTKAKKPTSLISTSGLLNTGITFPGATGGFRAEFVLNNFEYLVIGQNIYRRDINNVIIILNSTPLPTASGYVGVDANNAPTGSQILFVDGLIGCIWDTGTNQFTYDIGNRLGLPGNTALAPAFPLNPIDVCFLDGFLIVANGGTNEFQLSALNDAYTWGNVSNLFTVNTVTNPNELIVTTNYATGMSFQLTTTGVLPNPLVVGTTYYAIRVDDTHIKVASSYANALAGIIIILTTNGTPPNTITNFSGGAPGQLQQGQINTHPGNIVACRTLHRRLFLFSINYTEVWENSGQGTNLPFRRNNALLMEYGTPAVGSIVTGFDKMIFLSNDKDGLGAVMEVIGTESIPISNRALDFQLAQYAEAEQVSDARGIFIKENGIIFYRLNFTAANHTFVYNVTFSNPTQEEGKRWHEEQVLNGDRHPAQTHGYFNGDNYFGSYNKPVLYQVDPVFVTNDGETIPRIRIGRAYVPSTYNRTRCDRFMVDIIQGLAQFTNSQEILNLLTETSINIDTENGLDLLLESSGLPPIYYPGDHTIYLSISKDGGVTYNYRQSATIGAVGQRTHRTVWRKLGVIPRGQAFVPKIEFYGQIPFIILGAAWAFEVMPE
jgi:hypothetical protein